MQLINNEQTILVESKTIIKVLGEQRGTTDPTNFKIEVAGQNLFVLIWILIYGEINLNRWI